MTDYIIAIDPGVHMSGVAIMAVHDDTIYQLIYAGYQPTGDLKIPSYSNATLLIERPEKYPYKGKTHKDIDTLLAIVDTLKEMAKDAAWVCRTFTPAQWKGQVPKNVHHARVMRQLTEAEEAAVKWPADYLRHNVLDAIGLGLFGANRCRRGGSRLQRSSKVRYIRQTNA